MKTNSQMYTKHKTRDKVFFIRLQSFPITSSADPKFEMYLNCSLGCNCPISTRLTQRTLKPRDTRKLTCLLRTVMTAKV